LEGMEVDHLSVAHLLYFSFILVFV